MRRVPPKTPATYKFPAAIIRDSTTAVLLHPPESGRANQDARAIIGCNEYVAVVRRGEAPATEVDVGSAGLRGDDGLRLRARACVYVSDEAGKGNVAVAGGGHMGSDSLVTADIIRPL